MHLSRPPERIVRDFKGNPQAVPDYPALLGTMRVIQRETAAFRWLVLFDFVQRTIREDFKKAESVSGRPTKRRKGNAQTALELECRSITNHGLSFPSLQALLLGLESLQRFPEERQLFIECGTGITTLVVWCHHVLGQNVKVTMRNREIVFGKGPINVLVREIRSQSSNVSLIAPLSQNEPLFSRSQV